MVPLKLENLAITEKLYMLGPHGMSHTEHSLPWPPCPRSAIKRTQAFTKLSGVTVVTISVVPACFSLGARSNQSGYLPFQFPQHFFS